MSASMWSAQDEYKRPEWVAQRRAELRAHNRRIFAERLRWPAGVLEVCEALDAEHPAWSASWMRPNHIKGWERPAGYCATRVDGPDLPGGDQLRRLPEDGVPRTITVFAETVGELEGLIAAADERVEAYELEQQAMWESVRRGRLR